MLPARWPLAYSAGSRTSRICAPLSPSWKNLVEFDRLETFLECPVQRGAFPRVQDGVISEVGRRIGLVRGHETDEFLLGHGLERVVKPALIAQRRHRVRREILAAQRPSAVGGIYQHFIGQWKQLGVQGIVEVAAEFVRGPPERGTQVRPAYVADEKRVAGKHGERFRFVLGEIEDQDRDGFDGVTRSVQNLQSHAGKFERVAIVHRNEGIFRLRARAKVNRRAACIPQLEVAGHKIRVKVREEDVADLQAEFLGVRDILLDIALRVDHDRGSALFIAKQVRGMREATEIILFQDHGLLRV